MFAVAIKIGSIFVLSLLVTASIYNRNKTKKYGPDATKAGKIDSRSESPEQHREENDILL